jgi:hypothetical protein
VAGSESIEREALPGAEPAGAPAHDEGDAAPAARREGAPLAVRLLRAVPLPPGAAACVGGASLLLATALWMSVWDVPGSPLYEGLAFLAKRPFWFDAFSGALLACGLWILDRSPRSARRALEELRPRLGPPDPALDAAIAAATAHAPRFSRASGLAGLLLGVGFTLALVAGLEARGIHWPSGVLAGIMARNACVFGVLTQCFFQDLRIGRKLGAIVGARLRLGWSDAAAAAPLARHGLRLFGGWTVVSCAAAFFLLDETAVRFTLFFLALALGQAASVIWMPLQRARARVRAAKSEELARLDAEIARVSADVSAGALPAAEGWPRLGAIVAYRGLVASAREWPMDTPALGRLAFYLLLPVGSWIGGALVERALGWVIG